MTSSPASREMGVPHWTDIDWTPSIANRVINGLRLQYLDYGTGPAVVLLHGMASSWQWWLENIPALSQRHRVIAVDLPGFGESEPLPAPAEMATHARTVLDLLIDLGIESATVSGHSMGGLVAIEMFKADPRRTCSLILVDSGGVPMSEQRLAVILVVLRLCSAILRRRFVRRALATKMWVRRVALGAAFRDPRVMSPELAAVTMPVFGGPGSVDAIPAAARSVHTTVPESITCPVLLVWGGHDVVVPPSSAHQMHDKLRDCELAVFSGSGHSPMVELPDQFNDLALKFLATRNGDRRSVNKKPQVS
ncbi:alpha/beta fold hydrolase [Mycobacterium stomatepiae]|uniref:alpha/beta fold hydrolase n=1 Tax=Mycobacterium stomatepiae TaxID=470076 RepID=UPI0013D28340|nr:alpha/beta hydrolase [Mycobacterium stomatepiae]MCV7166052.1 alpha/beta hydrolase [Mycobacterium stomatepiae]